MTPEEIKRTWEEASRKMFRPSPEEFEIMYREKKETALERLASRYRRFSTLGMVMVVVSALWMLSPLPFASLNARLVIAILMMVYFATCSSIDYWLYRGIASIDCFTMSVSEVINKALYYRKKHLQSMMFLFPFAIGVVGGIIYALNADKYLIYGVIAGGVCGLILGYHQYRQFMDEYKIISENWPRQNIHSTLFLPITF